MKNLIAAFAVATVTLSTLPSQEPKPREDMAILAEAINDFGIRLYDEVATGNDNACISPVSVSAVLLMALVGAKGETADELHQLLGLGEIGRKWQPGRVQKALVDLMADLQASKGPAELNIVNDMWGQQDYGFLEIYRQQLQVAGVNLHELDFSKRPEQSRHTINNYIKKQTKGRIVDLLPKGAITPVVRQVLTNAVYFKARWDHVFSAKNTLDRPFTLSNGKVVEVPTMQQEREFAYAENEQLQVLSMRYEENFYEMVIFLPRAGQSIDVARSALQPDALGTWVGRMRGREVAVSLPKFELRSSYNKVAVMLQRMGLKRSFDSVDSDFSGVNGGGEQMPLGPIVHKTFLKVDEEGAEAAAATGLIRYAGRINRDLPAVFTADRPFVLAIRDSRNSSLLFIGQVTDPRRSER